jgi:hypothetical protein
MVRDRWNRYKSRLSSIGDLNSPNLKQKALLDGYLYRLPLASICVFPKA